MGTRGQRQLLASSSFNLGVQRYLLIRHELSTDATVQYKKKKHVGAKTHAHVVGPARSVKLGAGDDSDSTRPLVLAHVLLPLDVSSCPD